MKNFIALMLFALGLLSSQQVQSQVVIVKNGGMTFTYRGEVYPSIRSHSVTLPSGYILKTASFQLPSNHELVPSKGTYIIGMRLVLSYEVDEYGEPVLDEKGNIIPLEWITDEKVDINHKGKFNVTMHLNGAGHFLPIGWYIPD